MADPSTFGGFDPTQLPDLAGGWEQWRAKQDHKTCAICRSLHGALLPVGTGPHPPMHPRCRCHRIRVNLSRLEEAELQRMAGQSLSQLHDFRQLRRQEAREARDARRRAAARRRGLRPPSGRRKTEDGPPPASRLPPPGGRYTVSERGARPQRAPIAAGAAIALAVVVATIAELFDDDDE